MISYPMISKPHAFECWNLTISGTVGTLWSGVETGLFCDECSDLGKGPVGVLLRQGSCQRSVQDIWCVCLLYQRWWSSRYDSLDNLVTGCPLRTESWRDGLPWTGQNWWDRECVGSCCLTGVNTHIAWVEMMSTTATTLFLINLATVEKLHCRHCFLSSFQKCWSWSMTIFGFDDPVTACPKKTSIDHMAIDQIKFESVSNKLHRSSLFKFVCTDDEQF